MHSSVVGKPYRVRAQSCTGRTEQMYGASQSQIEKGEGGCDSRHRPSRTTRRQTPDGSARLAGQGAAPVAQHHGFGGGAGGRSLGRDAVEDRERANGAVTRDAAVA